MLTDDDELAELNLEHMGHEGPTDVLSFPMLPPEAFRGARGPGGGRLAKGKRDAVALARTHIGDIAISVERAAAQAAEVKPKRVV